MHVRAERDNAITTDQKRDGYWWDLGVLSTSVLQSGEVQGFRDNW